VAATGLVYFLKDDGVTQVVAAGPKFELVARNELGEKTYASPASCAASRTSLASAHRRRDRKVKGRFLVLITLLAPDDVPA
jgi:hypothetical protein